VLLAVVVGVVVGVTDEDGVFDGVTEDDGE